MGVHKKESGMWDISHDEKIAIEWLGGTVAALAPFTWVAMALGGMSLAAISPVMIAGTVLGQQVRDVKTKRRLAEQTEAIQKWTGGEELTALDANILRQLGIEQGMVLKTVKADGALIAGRDLSSGKTQEQLLGL